MYHVVAGAILGALLIWFGGCDGPKRVETPVLFAPPYDQESLDCLAPDTPVSAADGDAGPVDTLVVDIWAYHGRSAAPDGFVGSACRRCLEESGPGQQADGGASGDVRCELVARQCLCGGPWLSNDAVGDALTALRFSGVPGDQPLCVRLVGLPSGREPDPSEVAPAQSCRANVDQCTFDGSLDLAEEAKICILSDLSTLGNGNTPVLFDDFHCPRYDSIYKLCQDAFENIEPLLSDDIGVEDLFPQVCSMDWAIEARLCELFDPALDVLGALCDGYTGFSTAQCAGPLGS